MLDIKAIRHQPEAIREALLRRNCPFSPEALLAQDERKRGLLALSEEKKTLRNAAGRKMGIARKNGASEAEIQQLTEESRLIAQEIEQLDREIGACDETIRILLLTLPNLPDASAPTGKDESANAECRRSGTIRTFVWEPKTCQELGADLHIAQWEKNGLNAPVLRGAGARLYRALNHFLLDQFSQNGSEEIACSSPILNLCENSILDAAALPVLYSAQTDAQVEAELLAAPEQSQIAFEKLTRMVEDMLNALSLPSRTDAVCAGCLDFSASKAYAIGVWLPSQQAFIPAAVCSHCTDYEAGSHGIRYREHRGEKPRLVHTMHAAIRLAPLMAALLENHQNEDGSVSVPNVLAQTTGFSVIR